MLNPRNFARNPFSSIPQMVSKRAQGALSLQNDAMTLGEEALIGENEVVLHVQWQHRSRTTKVLQYAVLGSQTMAQLADAVYATDRWCLRSHRCVCVCVCARARVCVFERERVCVCARASLCNTRGGLLTHILMKKNTVISLYQLNYGRLAHVSALHGW